MKKIFTSLLVLPFILASCSSDDDSPIHGTWLLTAVTVTVETNNEDASRMIKYDFMKDGAKDINNKLLTFTQDGKLFTAYLDGRAEIEMRYKVKGNRLTISSLNKELNDKIVRFDVYGSVLTVYEEDTNYESYKGRYGVNLMITKILSENIFGRR